MMEAQACGLVFLRDQGRQICERKRRLRFELMLSVTDLEDLTPV